MSIKNDNIEITTNNNHFSYVPLYFKSEYSLLHSTCKISSTISLMKQYGYHVVAITDLSSMHGTLKFYNTCKDNNIKPIIGLHIEYTHNEKTSGLLLYATNTFGYRNLLRLSSLAKINKAPIPYDELSKNTGGLIVVVPYLENEVFIQLIKNNENLALNHWKMLQMDFPNIYLGMSILSNEEKKYFPMIYAFGQKNNIEMVAATPISFTSLDDSLAYQTVLSIAKGGEVVVLSESESNQYLRTYDEMEILFKGYEELLSNTIKISDKCNLDIGFNGYQLPKYDDSMSNEETLLYLKSLCIKGLKKRIQQNNINDFKRYQERLVYELNVIEKMGYADYFLIVWDYVKYAKNNNIYVGPGRGSAAASLVSYCLGITDIDPLFYNLLFERFLNPERISMPDIDIDFPDDKRDQVIQYVGEKYGKNRVAHISTFGTFKVKLAIRDTARVIKINENALKLVLKEIDKIDNKSLFLGKVSIKNIIEQNDKIIDLMNAYEEIDKLLTIASKIEGLPRNTSTHAAGIIITNYDLVNYTALDDGLDGIYQTQLEAEDLEKLGLLKMDFLGLRNLTIIDKCVDLIKFDYPTFSLPKNFDDKETYQMLAKGDVDGVFQLESAGMRKVIMELKTSSFDDINFALSLYRPGPMDNIPSFIRRKFNEEPISYPHPDLADILKETYGMIVYQDQIMLIAHKFAKYTLGEADVLRRAVSKKKKEVMEKERVKFVTSSIKAGYDEKTANDIYDYIIKFADYGFNKAHSVAYASISYITAYLKCHYFTYYLSTLMSSVVGSESDINRYYLAAQKRKIKIISPNINLSKNEFIVYDNNIVFPLSVIKGLGQVKTKSILDERLHGSFVDYEDFIVRTKEVLPYTLVENIIYSGALDIFGLTKKAMVDNYQVVLNKKEYDFFKSIDKTYTSEEFSYGELIEKEKEVIGMNLKYNFFHQYNYLYSEKRLYRISDLKEGIKAQTLGILKNIKVIKTKKDETMAFMSIVDENSKLELTLFPNTYQRYNDLTIGQIIIVRGIVQKRNELQLVVDEIEKV